MKKKILFLTGTRADFGKLKTLISSVDKHNDFEYTIFATGIHLLAKYGYTVKEIYRSGFENVFTYMNQIEGEDMEIVLANTIVGLSRYLHEHPVDMIVVHGDRVEALAGATTGALRNTLVAHIEGGEISGTIDELMRHAISKLSHIHFVASEVAEKRLQQLGEDPSTIFRIGSPDVDVMLSTNLPSLELARERYQIPFESYGVAILHPVTTEYEKQEEHANIFVKTLLESNQNYIAVYPNNDHGSEFIFKAYKKLEGHKNIRLFPSLRFEYFLRFLKDARFLIGNSSAGVHEAPIYGVPTINIGTRQRNRFYHESIFDIDFDTSQILNKISDFHEHTRYELCTYYGDGNSAEKFMEALESEAWKIANQKQFKDLNKNV
ncbi:UDP-N-acetyl glucosamine 2-epimerase [Halovibrio variabilis]|uniref:UDP-N-acetyl glucosamine 2-epimerase n=1 Tax=Halovibrio variabilis TaxID=31910 RepID=A0A511UJG5_9GAMM|nr:UDP-N-acetylglucosamine 2-epimerase [Halovibrio variabilis]GEN26710.1 UDP-N-acetyl glucosamine 2-epimerase [Halovibrio variabilis]